MPKPGPRPYECVRRAWHSDRHQPMRGSIIQQIFRLVHESHSAGTKKNREWQEKLPIVVLRAEEIMYSKANSEAEYMDFQTIWERVNNAINTIIRRDESAESGELLPPCVEAALYLGCVPVRASRSQHHMNPRSYLSPTTEGSASLSSKLTTKHTNNRSYPVPPHSASQSNLLNPLGSTVMNNSPRPAAMHPPSVVSQLSRHVLPESAPRKNAFVSMGLVYPLHYGTHLPICPEWPQFPFQIPKNSNPIIVGTPIFPSIAERNSLEGKGKIDFANNHDKSPEPGFDLSLRLGSFGGLGVGPERTDFDAISGSDSSNSSNLSPKLMEFCFFPMEANQDPYRFGTRG